MGRFFISFTVAAAVLLSVGAAADARHGSVLGTATDSPSVDLTVNQGPGFLLPSSPLYFLDLWRDNLALLLVSFNGEAKARLHLKIAGERLTEVKAMLEVKDVTPRGLDIALANITENVDGAVATLTTLRNQGKNVEKLAIELNDVIDTQQVSLKLIIKISDDTVRFKLKAVEVAIDEDEVEVEDELPEDKLAGEIENELENKLEDEVDEAQKAADKAFSLAAKLEKAASEAASKNLKKLEKALAKESKEQKEKAEKLFEQEKNQTQNISEARFELRKKTEDASGKIREVRKAVDGVREVREVRTSSGVSSPGGSSGSSESKDEDKKDEDKSGSSSSGSGSSGSSGSSGKD